ncbi:transposase [Amycolatopsis anabasis]|uniref:transposase n=1 Tax=Amycolatopsis anabasis TaxID=1840409 RepID=UPI001C553F47|nr:transposase [Amycolatopsis anabasis]
MRHPELVEQAMGRQALALLATLDAEAFRQHPDYAIITSFPGLADNAGARVLAEIGDDRNRFADARALKAYAGPAPITRASGRSISVTFRRVKNDRLAAAGWLWAFIAATHREPAKAHYRRRRDHGDRHSTARRHLLNRLLGQLYHCL